MNLNHFDKTKILELLNKYLKELWQKKKRTITDAQRLVL